ncbi:hypothetical protein EIP86_001457 [Pleurotus ostreatoroseus]|nr:hypothetical protein EIP86_001457 [Pleurotus ostreatoroseus]
MLPEQRLTNMPADLAASPSADAEDAARAGLRSNALLWPRTQDTTRNASLPTRRLNVEHQDFVSGHARHLLEQSFPVDVVQESLSQLRHNVYWPNIYLVTKNTPEIKTEKVCIPADDHYPLHEDGRQLRLPDSQINHKPLVREQLDPPTIRALGGRNLRKIRK